MPNLNIQENISLASHTTFKIGGPARFFVEVNSEEELLEALQYAKDNDLEFFILGGGSNILVSDNGFNGLVIKLLINSCKLQGTNLECGAGLNLAEAVKLAAENSLTGLEWAAGIPGTVGGAVRGNAGSPLGCIADSIEEVKVLEISNFKFPISNKIPNDKSQIPNKFQILNYKLQDCSFSYRDSVFKKNNNLIITSTTLKLKKGDKHEIESIMKEVVKKRSSGNYPNPKEPSPGSFFKNPVVKDKELIARFEKDTVLKIDKNKTLYHDSSKEVKLPAGWLIEEIGFLGKKVGKVQVSEKHGNFVINLGGGKAEEAVILASLIKQKVREKFHVQLIEEVQFVGF